MRVETRRGSLTPPQARQPLPFRLARWAIPALALVPPFFAFNVAATPDPPVVDLGPVIGMYATVLSVRLLWLGAARVRPRK